MSILDFEGFRREGVITEIMLSGEIVVKQQYPNGTAIHYISAGIPPDLRERLKRWPNNYIGCRVVFVHMGGLSDSRFVGFRVKKAGE